jgi:hypothetical protein
LTISASCRPSPRSGRLKVFMALVPWLRWLAGALGFVRPLHPP